MKRRRMDKTNQDTQLMERTPKEVIIVGKENSKTCFIICPIGSEESETRKRSDQVLKHIVTPAVRQCGYEDPVRADSITEPGNIASQVIQRIYDADLVVADLTERNPNVFYELAVRHAAKKPVIMMMKAGGTIPFDVAQDRVIFYDHKDLDSAEKCKKDIVKQILSFRVKFLVYSRIKHHNILWYSNQCSNLRRNRNIFA